MLIKILVVIAGYSATAYCILGAMMNASFSAGPGATASYKLTAYVWLFIAAVLFALTSFFSWKVSRRRLKQDDGN